MPSLAVAIAIVAITAVVVIVATIRATLFASSVLAELLASQFCSRPCLPDVAVIVVVLACALSLRRVDARCARQLSSSRRFSALAHRHAVAFLLIVAFDASNSAAMAATIAIVAIIAISSSLCRRRCDPRHDCCVTVTPFSGVLVQRSLLAQRSLRRFIDVVIFVVVALGAFRRVPRSSLLCRCRCRRNNDTTGSRRVVRPPSRPWRFAATGITVGALIAAVVRRHDGTTGSRRVV